MSQPQQPEHSESLIQANQEVDELCGCPGKEKTMSRRVMKINHEPWCFYFMHLEDKLKEAMGDLKEKYE